jgi:hypothetical protein
MQPNRRKERPGFLTWNRRRWAFPSAAAGDDERVSCYSRFYCVAIRLFAEVEAWNGFSWHAVAGSKPCSAGSSTAARCVMCPAPTAPSAWRLDRTLPAGPGKLGRVLRRAALDDKRAAECGA